MAEFSGFFDAHLTGGKYDRAYLAEHFAKYFASFISNGVFGGKSSELIVRQKEVADMSVRVLAGQAFIGGYFYENDDELSLSIDIADGVLNRIDLIALRWDNVERVIRLVVKKGIPATNPATPVLQRDADCYELQLAKIYVQAGVTSITQDRITDTRLDSKLCGFVTGAVQSIDTTNFGIQINGVIERLEKVAEENDVASLILNIDNLERSRVIGYESTEYPGCFYRVVDGRTEWLNPPRETGIEYCTYERYEGKPVYQLVVYAATLPNKTLLMIDTNVAMSKIISIEGYATNANGDFFPFPVVQSMAATPIAAISNVVASEGFFMVYTASDMTKYQGYFTIRYTKS